MSDSFEKATETVILSDIHLTEAEPPHPRNPLWKRYKRRAHFVDPQFQRFIRHVLENAEGPVELILNGDIFDFDSVMRLPSREQLPDLRVNWLERIRGLGSEERKSLFKMEVILEDHPVFREAVREFMLAHPENRFVLVLGNHDVELHWPSVRDRFIESLDLPAVARDRMRFCEWFYLSNRDTLVEHGNQYDSYSLCQNPVNPLIRKGFRPIVRIPFGNLAGKIILNGIGLMNPHANSSFIKSSLREYLVFYFKYVMRVQPLLLFTFVWSAVVTAFDAVAEGLLPAMRDPLTIESRVSDIARRANATTGMVLALQELHAHPAVLNPVKLLRELWLDRVVLFSGVLFFSFEFFVHLSAIFHASLLWFVVPLAILLPLFIFYARSVESELAEAERAAFEAAPLAARICGVSRVVHGHTHLEKHVRMNGLEYLNPGTWSNAYHDPECQEPYGRKCFTWIRPDAGGGGARKAELYEWTGIGAAIVPIQEFETKEARDGVRERKPRHQPQQAV